MAKRFDIHESPFGLCSEPDVLKAPKGALSLATNCVMPRDGILECRNGADGVSLSGSNLSIIYRMFNFDGDLLLYDDDTPKWEFLGNLGNEVQDEDSNDPQMFPSYYNAKEAKNNLYVCCDDGVRKITSSDSTDFFAAGVLPDVKVQMGSAADFTDQNWWTTGTYIKYTMTVQRRDANDNVIESAQSCPEGTTHSEGADRVPFGTFWLGPSLLAGDTLRLFRTPMASSYAATGANYYLAGEVVLTSTDITNGYVYYNDFRAESELSEALYCNPMLEGAGQNNFRPPVAKCISLFNKSMFYSNVILPSRVNFSMTSSVSDLAGETTQAGTRGVTATSTISDPILTSVSDMSGVEVGQYIDGNNIPEGTYIIALSVGSSTITMSQNATASGAVTADIHDTITFGYGSTYETYIPVVTLGATGYFNAYNLARDMIKNDSTDYYPIITGPIFAKGSSKVDLTIERRDLNSSTFYVWATHGESYDPPLSGPTYSGGFVFSTSDGLQSDMLSKPNRQYWSKSDQPEHVPVVGNHHDVGNGSPIIQTVETKDGLIVFKDDGIYTVTGDGSYTGWTVRPLDREHVLACPSAAVHVDGWVYALTNYGFVRVNMFGVEKISFAYIDIGFPISSTSITKRVQYFINIMRGGVYGVRQFVRYDQRGQNIIISIEDSSYSVTNYVLIYNLKTHALTSWTFAQYVCDVISADYDSGYLYYAGRYCASYNGGVTPIYLWKDNDLKGCDNDRSLTVDSKTGTTRITFTTDHDALTGDYVIDGTEQQEILDIWDTSTVVVADNTNISGTCHIYTPIVSTIKWLPKYGETRSYRKKFVAYGLIFRVNPAQYSLQLKSGGSSYGPFDLAKTTERRIVPVGDARELFLEPKITITDMVNEWELVGMFLEYFLQQPRGT